MGTLYNLVHLPVPMMKKVGKTHTPAIGPQSQMSWSDSFDRKTELEEAYDKIIQKHTPEMLRQVDREGFEGVLTQEALESASDLLKEYNQLQLQLQKIEDFDIDSHLIRLNESDSDQEALLKSVARWDEVGGPEVKALKKAYGFNPFLTSNRLEDPAYTTVKEANAYIRNYFEDQIAAMDPGKKKSLRLNQLHDTLIRMAVICNFPDELPRPEQAEQSSGSEEPSEKPATDTSTDFISGNLDDSDL